MLNFSHESLSKIYYRPDFGKGEPFVHYFCGGAVAKCRAKQHGQARLLSFRSRWTFSATAATA